MRTLLVFFGINVYFKTENENKNNRWVCKVSILLKSKDVLESEVLDEHF